MSGANSNGPAKEEEEGHKGFESIYNQSSSRVDERGETLNEGGEAGQISQAADGTEVDVPSDYNPFLSQALYVGMKFNSLDDAHEYLKELASHLGFSLRKESSRKSNGILCYQMYACSLSGSSRNEWATKTSLRCNCPWNVKIWRNIDKEANVSSWKVSSFNNNHNHSTALKASTYDAAQSLLILPGPERSESSYAAPAKSSNKRAKKQETTAENGSQDVADEAAVASVNGGSEEAGAGEVFNTKADYNKTQKALKKKRFVLLTSLAKQWVELSAEQEESTDAAVEFLNRAIADLSAQHGLVAYDPSSSSSTTSAQFIVAADNGGGGSHTHGGNGAENPFVEHQALLDSGSVGEGRVAFPAATDAAPVAEVTPGDRAPLKKRKNKSSVDALA